MAKISVKAGRWQLDLSATNNRIELGRDPDCDLTIDDPSVSRHHAQLSLQGEQLVVQDLGSSNGTWLDGRALGRDAVVVRPNQSLFVGTVPVHIQWSDGPQQGSTRYEANMGALIQQSIDAARAQASVAVALAAPVAAPSVDVTSLAAQVAPEAGVFPNRRQGKNNNGVLLLAVRQEAYTNGDVLDGVLEFTALDNETVNSITVQLVEVHRRGPSGGHIWDRMIVRQGPWNSVKNDIVLLPFQLRVPGGTSATSADVSWEIRGYVDIAWAYDVETSLPIMMRNTDVEMIRDALGTLDYRVADLRAEPLGQKYIGSFQPSPTRIKELGITDIHFTVEYLGVNIKLTVKVEKSSLFKFDKSEDLVIAIDQLRAMNRQVLSGHLQAAIERMMAK